MKSKDEAFEQRVRTTLDTSVTGLDAETRSRLSAIRRKSLGHKPLLSRWLPFENWIPATALAVCAVLAVILIVSPSYQEAPDQLALQDTDEPISMLELLLSEDDQGEIGDPDFYVWLDAMLLEDEVPKNAG